MPARARRAAVAGLYGVLVFAGTAALGFAVLPPLAHASGWFPIETEAAAAFSLVTLKAVPLLAGLSAGAAFSYERLASGSVVRRILVYALSSIAIWLVGASIAVFILG